MSRHCRTFGLWRNPSQSAGLGGGGGGAPALKFNAASNSQYLPLVAF